MSALRKEEPLTTADIANQRADRGDVVDETNIDPADRRPPRSAAGPSSAVTDTTADRDDTYDGEIVDSHVDSSPSGDNVGSGRQFSASARGTSSQPYTPGRESTAAQTSTASSQSVGQNESPGSESPLFAENELRDFRGRWDQIQTSFVDEPRHAVEQADTLVASVVKRIAEQFSEERAKLEKQWDRGDNVSTEDLRQGFKRYRAFFDRLLSF
jgi:hypothetical protein